MNHALVQSSNLTWDMFQTVATPSGVSTLDPCKIMFISCPTRRPAKWLLSLRNSSWLGKYKYLDDSTLVPNIWRIV